MIICSSHEFEFVQSFESQLLVDGCLLVKIFISFFVETQVKPFLILKSNLKTLLYFK